MSRGLRKAFLACAILTLAAWFLCAVGSVWAAANLPSGSAKGLKAKGKTSPAEAVGKKQKANKAANEEEGKKGKERPFPPPNRVWDVATIILGCPSDRHISVSIHTRDDLEGYIEYGKETSPFTDKSEMRRLPGKTPVLLSLDGLIKDTAYTYRLCYRKPGEREFQKGPAFHFHTQRSAGSPFTFAIQGDSHPERVPKQNDPALYEQTLLAVAKDRPDFFICMGDDFSVDTLPEVTAASVARVYLKQLPYLGLVAHSSPLFLVNGNHEQAARCNLNGTANNVAVWAQVNRNRLFPQPAPDGFYGGDAEKVEYIGLLRDYYAWTWGDALFVVIDPYWHSNTPVDNVLGGGQKRPDLWDITLGDAQYKWLKETLEGSHARFKFVFAHHVNGTGRGGIEMASQFEWGGKNKRGVDEFASKRPGWGLPIHQLMAKNGVTIFFQGHDHIFCKQMLDGVVYQTLPEPADPSYTLYNKDAYVSGDALPNSGRARVTVSPGKVSVEYVRSYLPRDATVEHPDGEIAYSYSISARAQPMRRNAKS